MKTHAGRTEAEQREFNKQRTKTPAYVRWHKEHPRYKAEYKREWHRKKLLTEEGRRASKNRKLFQDYRITIEDYEVLLVKQDNRCASCGINFNDTGQRACVDHNHGTGKIRGLLCDNCNHGIGMFSDDVSKLQRAIDYLVRTTQ